MSKREFASIMLKLLGIYALLQAVIMVTPLILSPGLFNPHTKYNFFFWSALVKSTFPALLLLATAVVLLAYSGSLARKLIKEDGEFSLLATLSGREFQAICFSVAAVFIFASGISGVTMLFSSLWTIASARSQDGIVAHRHVSYAWAAGFTVVLRLGLAAYLFFGAPRLADYWHRIHNAPQPPGHA